jgi:hypothetical protein
MDETQRKNCEIIRNMSSSDAADWLLTNHPNDGCFYVAKRTWKKQEQIRLANHFLSRIPHATDRCYEALLSVMALPRFVEVVEANLPEESSKKNLLEYYLLPALNKFVKSPTDKAAVAHVSRLLS